MHFNDSGNGLMWGFPYSKHDLSGVTGAVLQGDHGSWIILWFIKQRGLLNLIGRKVNVGVVSTRNFWDPFPNKQTVWIKFLALFDGIVYSQGIYTSGTRLHLKLTEMNAGFIIGEGLCQVGVDFSPV